jgi:arginase
MGLGPIKLMKSSLVQDLLDQGHDLRIEAVRYEETFENELEAIIKLNNRLKLLVKNTIKDSYFPLILGGNCNTCLGTLAGLNSTNTGIIWFDAHGDFNTPEITPSGFLDGMPLAIATGQCYHEIWSQIAEIEPIKESFTIHIGERDLDPKERTLLNSTDVCVISSADLKETKVSNILIPTLKELSNRVKDIYLHIDIDILDPQEAPGVDYRTPNGISSRKLVEIIEIIAEVLTIKAAAITAYNPIHEENDKTLQAILYLITRITGILSKTKEVK